MFKSKFITLFFTFAVFIAGLCSSDSFASYQKAKKTTTSSASKTAKKSSASSTKKKSSGTSGKSTSKKKTTGKASKSSTTKKNTSSASKKTTKRSSKKKITKKRKKRTNKISHKKYVAPIEVAENDSLTLYINEEIIAWLPENINPGGLRVNSVKPNRLSKTALVKLNDNFTYLPVNSELIEGMRKRVTEVLPDSIRGYDILFKVGDKNYSYYITMVEKLPEKYRDNVPFVRPVNRAVNNRFGMEGDIVAMWHSHGRYFKPGTGSWMWQRPQLFGITEDTHTLSYIVPYAVPMLENAGAYVFLPKERDVNIHEVIIDNDINEGGAIYSQPYYWEISESSKWETGEGDGFIYDLPDFRDTENPFENGTYRQTETIVKGKPSLAAWCADIPEDGEYAVYVSYKSLPNSSTDAHYTVNYSGGSKEFLVNQKMGGGTWIYLGTFPFEKGFSATDPLVVLSNDSKTGGAIVTADAVKIGGGIGNIARSGSRADIYLDPSTPEEEAIAVEAKQVAKEMEDEELNELDNGETQEGDDETADDSDEETDMESEDTDDEQQEQEEDEQIVNAFRKKKDGSIPTFKTSGLPRFLEGARYWLHWAGMPEYVYSPYHGTDDYKDDYTSRGHWVNYLSGGSRVLPNQEGLGIPVDLCVALHSDAGKRADDTFVGTLGIYYTNGGDSYVDGTSRSNSRTLTDMLMRQITNDIRMTWEPNWTRRSMWDQSYVEARVPEVPTSLIEFMSHQNYADMVYALDPAFRFTVGRSIYKAIGRFISERKNRKFIVQPLPVKNFHIQRSKPDEYKLKWEPTPDRLEPTAEASKYLVYERTDDDLGFHLLGMTSATNFTIKVNDTLIHSFKIVAANEGGYSFPSEILSLCNKGDDSKPVLIINGFTRISGPGHFSKDNEAGFNSEDDFGVPYIKDISFMGHQTEFRRNAGEAFGRSSGNYASQVICGNTFDYPYIHGVSISNAGKGFVSTSVGAILSGDVKLSDFNTVDLILGKQKTTVTGNGNTGMRYTAFPEKLQKELREFVKKGGNYFISGAYIMSDLADYRSPDNSIDFAENILGISMADGPRPVSSTLAFEKSNNLDFINSTISFCNKLNDKQYIVENPDLIQPSGKIRSTVFVKFTDNSAGAGVLTNLGKSKGIVMSVPFESISSASDRDNFIRTILKYFETPNI